MGQVLVTESNLQNIANAIRAKSGSSDTYSPAQMAQAIIDIPGGGATIKNQEKTATPSTISQKITYDSGYTGLSTVTINAMPAGSAGTPVASTTKVGKSITVTPSVTNVTGYITGGSVQGDSLTVYPADVVSGTVSIDTNGIQDVTSYKYADVNVSGGGGNPGSLQIDNVIESSDVMPYVNQSGYLVFTGVGNLASTFTPGQINTNPTPNEIAMELVSQIPTWASLTTAGSVVTAHAGYYESDTDAAVAAGSVGTPVATKGSVSNHAISVTPSVTSTTGYITGGTKTGTAVSVAASELVSSTMSISSNGVSDVTNYKAVNVNVSGGATNVVAGTFKTNSSSGTQTITIPYTGSGYPVAAMVYIKGGMYNNGTGGNTTWYNSTQRYAVGQWTVSKSRTNETPTYGTSGTQNQGVTTAIYKNSTSASTTYTRTSATTTNVYTSSAASSAALTCCRFKGNAKTLNIYVASSGYGLLANTEYEYIIYYSS